MNHTKKIAVVDYGLSNLYSITKALRRFTDNVFITEAFSDLKLSDAAVLPGVGAFEEGIKGLRTRGMVEPLQAFVASGKPLLGICLGAQLLLSRGYEFGVFTGLNIIPGEVIPFPVLPQSKIPHMGWNSIYPGSNKWTGTLLDTIPQNATMYFVHSYVLKPEMREYELALTEYGGYEFCSVIRKGNVYGCQFHPEKSGEAGLHIIKNFVSLTASMN